jgi:hypothetical protein
VTAIERLRSHRIGPFAIFDFAASYLAAWYGAPYLNISRKRAMWLIIPLGILVHELIGLKTPLNKMVVGPGTNILAQAVVALMIFKGIKG